MGQGQGQASTRCQCNQGFYRPNTNEDEKCIALPTEPKNLTIAYMDATSISLAWNPQENNLNNNHHFKFQLKCFKCVNKHDACRVKRKCESRVRIEPTDSNDGNAFYSDRITL